MKFRVRNWVVEKLNNIKLREKLIILQVFCVLLPLLATDTIIIGLIVRNEHKASIQEMNNISESVKYNVGSYVETATSLIQKIYGNQITDNFSKREFENTLDYYNNYVDFIKSIASSEKYNVVIYMDNPGVVNGGYCKKLSTVENEDWYKTISESDDKIISYCEYAKVNWETRRQISIIRKLDYYGNNKDVLKVDLNYNDMLRSLMNAMYSHVVYVCNGDTILLSNEGKGGLYDAFDIISEKQKNEAAVINSWSVYGQTWDIYVMSGEANTFETIQDNYVLLITLLIINIFLPFTLMSLINTSFTQRIHMLDGVLQNVDLDRLKQLPEVSGNDEISALMQSYNRMANRMNFLIDNEYKNKIKQQESDIARQKAELRALHSQINPHFLFNALESIRMHSVIKQELETASMVEKLALMQRQNVEWGNDAVSLRDEFRFIEAYLELQKYRFGAKLKYEIETDEDCMDKLVPKLSVVTFVENACVHGMENKTSSCWVFVRVSASLEEIILEIEDTGNGMTELEARQMEEDMNHVRIEMLKEGRRVGVLNAALRLKMYFSERVNFEVESEKGTGTLITINIPFES